MTTYQVQKAYTEGSVNIEADTPEAAAEKFFNTIENPSLNNLIAVDNLVFRVSSRDKLYITEMNSNYTQR